jgi:dihydroorotase
MMPAVRMISRRGFLGGSLAAAAAAARVTPSTAARFDLLIQGGRVLDASQHLDRVADIAIRGGRIVAVEPGLHATDAADVIDARGRIVTPGLVDIHAHASETIPAFALSTGVTTLVDAGSKGADNVDALVATAAHAPNRVRILLNLSRIGIDGGNSAELLAFENADVPAARRAVDRYGDAIVGVKARLSRSVARDRDLEAIRLAHEITGPSKLPLMVHIGDTASPLPAIVKLLRPGDILTHVYAPQEGILDGAGRVHPEVRDARRRGVLFDVGNGRGGHITWNVAERAMQQGFLPDTISSDLTDGGRTDRVFDFPTVLSKFLMLGMPVAQVMACATVNAARAIPALTSLGTLRRGAIADVAVFELMDGDFEFVDNVKVTRTGHHKLRCEAVVVGGKRAAAGNVGF